ncbi:MAG: phytanoyl-CoA dioxygenase family protein [Chloroflexi bacterium]|nr:phytanoyl-CoA dioxygenase family protein [Chloroflexota bacterium]
MDFVKITPEQKRQFDEEGYLIMREAIDSETVSALIEAGDRLIASDRQLNRQRRPGGKYDGFRNCVSMDEAFRPLITNPKVFSIVAQLLSPYLSLLTSHLIYRAPDPPGSPDTERLPGWHRDHYMSMRDLGDQHIPRHSLKVAYYLTDLSEPNTGVTMVAARSNQLKERIEIPEGQVDPASKVEPLLNPGDAVFFENRTWHAGAANLTDRTRKAVMIGYSYDWITPTDYRQQAPELVEKLSPMERYLVGEPADDNPHFDFTGGYNPIAEWCAENEYQHNPKQGDGHIKAAGEPSKPDARM